MPPHEIVQALEIHEISVDEASELAFCCDLLELFDLTGTAELPEIVVTLLNVA
ncbi:hypothetical protein [Jiella pacifica]|uniref:Uncharacterized protein n=1 Tax=Jiella pacifica TaxID=2696469 RepID=A0A6N9TB69_9HYPH|nr:hypothetical protein [Jiella pacifica]NDW07306.1 hypothetical protein [Jiella pacifica]